MTPQDISAWLDLIWNLGIGIRLVLIVTVVGYVFRALPFFPNNWLWLVCGLAGAAMFPFMAHPRDGEYVWLFWARTGVVGLFVGMGAATLHDRVLSKNGWGLETRIPMLRNVIDFIDHLGKGRRRNHKKPRRKR
jgi:hypothetical protein